jgi:hypothetical protein
MAADNMIPYVIRQGDHLPKLAVKMGFDPDAVWNHPKNADLRALRSDWHMLCACDILQVPEPKRQWKSLQVGSQNRFTAAVPRMQIRVAFCRGGKPLANADCVVHGLPPPNQLSTDGDGKLSFAAPVTLESVTVEFAKPHFVQRLRIGHLDPIDEPSGVYQRLKNLGVQSFSGPLPTSFDEAAMGQAVQTFQNAQGLPATGEVDDATRSRLKDAHGC